METLYNGLYSLTAEVSEDKFKSYDELKKKFLRVIGGGTSDTSSFTAESVASTPETQVSESTADDIPLVESGDVEEDNTMSYFSKLAEA